MGNIITQSGNANAFAFDGNGGVSVVGAFTGNTGTFNKVVNFNDNVNVAAAKAVNVAGTLKVAGNDFTDLYNSVSTLKTSAGAGSFVGAVSAASFTGTTGSFGSVNATTGAFTTISTSNLDINGNITSTSGPQYITASTGSGLKLMNGTSVTDGFIQIINGSVNITPSTSGFLNLNGAMTGSASVNLGSGTFSSLTTNSLSATGGITTSTLSTSGLISANGGISLPSTGTFSLAGNMTGAGSITAGSLNATKVLSGNVTTVKYFSSAFKYTNINTSSVSTNNIFPPSTSYSGIITNISVIVTDFNSNATSSYAITSNAPYGYLFPITTINSVQTYVTSPNVYYSGTLPTFSVSLSAANAMFTPSVTLNIIVSILDTSGSVTSNNGLFNTLSSLGTFTPSGGITLPSTANFNLLGNMTGSGSVYAGTGTFSNLITNSLNATGTINANGGLNIPTNQNLTLTGNMTGTGSISAGTGAFSSGLNINQPTTLVYTATGGAGSNGLNIKGASNTWSISEVKGPKTSVNRLCFSLNSVPFACIDPTSQNLVPGNDSTW